MKLISTCTIKRGSDIPRDSRLTFFYISDVKGVGFQFISPFTTVRCLHAGVQHIGSQYGTEHREQTWTGTTRSIYRGFIAWYSRPRFLEKVLSKEYENAR